MTTSTFPLSGNINLLARVAAGSLTVHAVPDCEQASVTLTARHHESDIVERTRVELDGHTLTVQTPKPASSMFGRSGRHDELDAEIAVPAGTAMRLEAYSARVDIDGVAGSVELAVGSGAVSIAHIDGELRLVEGSGRIELGTVTGAAQIKSGSGQVAVGRADGALNVSVGSGKLQLGRLGGPVKARAGSGSCTVASTTGDLDLTTGSGAVRIGLPAGQQAQLDVHSGSGRLSTEQPVDSTPPSGPAILIRVRTGSGNVTVHRAELELEPLS